MYSIYSKRADHACPLKCHLLCEKVLDRTQLAAFSLNFHYILHWEVRCSQLALLNLLHCLMHLWAPGTSGSQTLHEELKQETFVEDIKKGGPVTHKNTAAAKSIFALKIPEDSPSQTTLTKDKGTFVPASLFRVEGIPAEGAYHYIPLAPHEVLRCVVGCAMSDCTEKTKPQSAQTSNKKTGVAIHCVGTIFNSNILSN